MQDLAFESYLTEMSTLFRTAAEIGIELDELITRLSRTDLESTPST